jgi:hypothetical protein
VAREDELALACYAITAAAAGVISLLITGNGKGNTVWIKECIRE